MKDLRCDGNNADWSKRKPDKEKKKIKCTYSFNEVMVPPHSFYYMPYADCTVPSPNKGTTCTGGTGSIFSSNLISSQHNSSICVTRSAPPPHPFSFSPQIYISLICSPLKVQFSSTEEAVVISCTPSFKNSPVPQPHVLHRTP